MPKVISLFSGAGGLDYGFEAAGFQTVVANELDPVATATLHANREFTVIERDVHDVTADHLLRAGGLSEGEADVLIGGPPCQPFSKAGYWASGDSRRLDDPRADTLYAYMRLVRDTQPRVFLLENVAGINYTGKGEGFDLLQRLADTINRDRGTSYELSWAVVNATSYGVPQHRSRFVLVGHRDGRRFRFPDATHVVPSLALDASTILNVGLLPPTTAWDAIGSIEPDPTEDLRVRGQWADLLPSIPEGENYLWHTSRKGGLPLFGWRTRFWSFLLKLAKDRPSWTIQAQPGPAIGPFHWSSRLLSASEMAALQTFPPGIQFAGRRLAVQRQIGNAVPSLMAEVLARAIARQLLDHQVDTRPVLAVAPSRPVPGPAPVRAVPERYLSLIGEHAAHPGTGRGNAALRRSAPVELAAD